MQSQKDFVRNAVSEVIEELPESDWKCFVQMLKILEEKDQLKYEK